MITTNNLAQQLNWYVGEVSTAVYGKLPLFLYMEFSYTWHFTCCTQKPSIDPFSQTIVSNIPLCWPLVRRIFSLDAFGHSTKSSENTSASHVQSNSTTVYFRGSRKRERLPSDTGSGVGYSESEERITGTWSPQPQEGHLELHPLEDKTGFKTQIAVGKDLRQRREDWESKETIIKTVQISQHHS